MAADTTPPQPVATSQDTYGYSGIVAEYLFVLVPFLVLGLVFAYQQRGLRALLSTPEWAFASALLFGQTIVKFVAGVVAKPAIKERVAVFVSIVLVLGLIPAMSVLALLLVSSTPPTWLTVAQIVLFVLASVLFIGIGAMVLDDQ